MVGINQTLQRFSTSTLLYTAFGASLAMLLVLGSVRGYESAQTSNQIDSVINNRMVKIKYAAMMSYAARERTLGLHGMILTGDAFSRDEQWLAFNRFGGEFARARIKILSMPLNEQEANMMELQGRLTREALGFQERVIELIERGQMDTARNVLQRGAIPAQNKVIQQLTEFYQYQEGQAERAGQLLSEAFEQSQSALRAVTTLFIGLCGLFGFAAIRTARYREEVMTTLIEKSQQSGQELSHLIGKSGLAFSEQLHALEGDVEYAISTAREQNPLNKHVLAHLGEVIAKARYLNTVAELFVELARLDTGHEQVQFEEIEVHPLVTEVTKKLQPFTLRNNNSISLQCSDRIGSVTSDRKLLSGILESLLIHTCYYTEYGMITLNVVRDKDSLVFRVEDTGKGSNAADLSDLFATFEVSDRHSTNQKQRYVLNLALQRRLCRLLGGELELKTEINIGTTCVLRLPAPTAA